MILFGLLSEFLLFSFAYRFLLSFKYDSIKAHKHLFIDNDPSKGLNPDNELSLKVYNSSTTHMDIILSNVVNDIINYFN